MKIAVLSDIHANQEALESVLNDAERRGAERFWFLGDAVGYGPDPQAPLLWLKYYLDHGEWVLGNHDAFFAGLVSKDTDGDVSPTALRALELNRKRLDLPENAEASQFCQAELQPGRIHPVQCNLDGVDYVLVHSSQKDPLGLHRSVYAWQEDIFLPQEFAALEERSLTSGRPSIQLYGHTHVPTLVYGQRVGEDFAYHAVKVCPGQTYSLEAGLAIINPGSVGFPRDRDNRAAYTLLDTAGRMLTFLRVGYDWMETAQKLAREGYPDLLRNRLRFADVAGDTPQDWKKHFEKVREC